MRNSSTIKQVYSGNGVTRRWSIPFEYLNTSEICAVLTTVINGAEQETEIDSADFQIDTSQNELIYPKSNDDAPLETGKKITVYRNTDTLQLADYTNQGALWPDSVEDSLDKLHQIVQEHAEALGRTFQTNKSSSVSPKEYAEALINASDAAVTAASNAATSETNAGLSATAAANSASAALASQNAAALSETNAGTSATSASNSATAAGNSQTAAANSASAALASQNAAALSETNAGTSETNASTSATAAGNSATAAANSAAAAAAADARISDRWGLRKPDTVYAADDITYHVQLPTGWYLECSTGGTTASGDLTITSPTLNDTISDGTVVWIIRKISSADGAHVGDIKAIAYNGAVQAGWLLCDGSAVSRTMYPDLFAAIGTTYGAGDGSTTFNVPDINQAARFLQGGSTAGVVKSAGLPNITGGITAGGSGWALFLNASARTVSGAINGDPVAITTLTGGIQTLTGICNLTLDASLSNSIYGASTTVQPPALTSRFIIKAFDGQTASSALIDVTQYANDLAGKADRQLSNLDMANLSCHLVVDSYYDSTTGDWWREYDDGWVEQGGEFTGGVTTINLLKAMANAKYSVTIAFTSNSTATIQAFNMSAYQRTTTGFTSHGANLGTLWTVAGMGAQS